MADVTKRSFGTETKPSTRSCEESIGFRLDRLEKAMEKQKETFDKFFKTVMASLSNPRLSIAEVCEDARVALNQFQETKVLPIHEIAMAKCDSVLQQPEDVSDSVSDEEQVLEADLSILEIEETKTVPYEATILKEPLLLDNSQEPQVLQSLLEPSHRICNKTREILKELQYVDVRKDELQGCCDCGIGKIDAVQMFDQMSSGITSIEKPLKSVKNWKFKFKDGYEKKGIQVYSSVRCDSLNECWLIFGIEKLCKEEVQKNDWKSMEAKMLVRELLCLSPSNKDPSQSPMNAKSLAVIELLLGQMVMEAKESMKQRETSSQVYKNMQEIFIKMDKSTLAQTLVRELQDLKETMMKKIDYERDNKEENGFDTEKDRVASLAVRVQEHRVSNLLQLLQVGDAVRVMPAIKLIPTWGYFAYRAINSIIGNQLFKLTVPLLVPPSKRFKVVEESHTYFLEKGSYKSTARFTLLQVFNLGICYKVTGFHWLQSCFRFLSFS